MDSKIKTGAELKPLLNRFVDESLLTEDVLAFARKFLFGGDLEFSFFKDDDLYETVFYLKDLMEVNHLKSVCDVIFYLDRKKQSMTKFIECAIEAHQKQVEKDDTRCSDKLKDMSSEYLPCVCHSYLSERVYNDSYYSPLVPKKPDSPALLSHTRRNRDVLIQRDKESQQEQEYFNI